MSTTVRTRAEQPVEHTWDVHSVFPDDAAWEAALSELDAVLPQLEGFRGRLGESARVLLEGLRFNDRVMVDANRVMLYAHMQYDVDSADPVASARFERAISLMTRVAAAGAGRVSEITAIGRETLDAWMAEVPDLRLYAQYFDVLLRNGADIRSIQAWLGHSQLQTTAIYLRTDEQQVRKIAPLARLQPQQRAEATLPQPQKRRNYLLRRRSEE
jgi:oligoendopeptidase F